LLWLAPLALVGCADRVPPAVENPELLLDVTGQVGLDYRHFSGMTGRRYIVEMLGPGAALADLDGDGDLDLFLRQGRLLGDDVTLDDALDPPAPGSPLTNRLYRSDATADDPGFRLVERSTGLDHADYGMGVATGDFDRDGAVDLYLTSFGEDRLLRNRGDATFEDVTAAAGLGDDRLGQAAVFFDYDGDGWLDLYVQNYVSFSLATHKPCFAGNSAIDYCGPLSFKPEPDRLFRNRGDGTFEAVSAESGIARAFGAGMGAVARDYDGDGRLDLYVNDGAGYFTDATRRAGLAVPSRGYTGFGTAPIDLDNDGLLDLVAVNGEVRAIAEQDATGDALPLRQHNQVFRNLGGGTFVEASTEYPAVSSPLEVSRAAVVGDLDGDGAGDLLITNNSGPARVLWNRGAGGAHWIGVSLRDPLRRLDGAGSRVQVMAGAVAHLRYASSDGSYLAASDPRVVVGLGAESEVESVVVDWTAGRRVRITKPPIDSYLVVGSKGTSS
jgi:hypothetical protein